MDPQALLDPRFLQPDPSPVDVPDVIRDGRSTVLELGRLLDGIADPDLGRPWTWSGEGEEDVRTGAYLGLAALHDGAGEADRAIRASGIAPGPAGGALSAVLRARWELHGILESLDESVLDADPGAGEWSVRATLGHIIESQRSYAWFSAWWLGRRDGPLADRADESHGEGLPDERREASGSSPVILQRLDSLVDLSTSLWSVADADALAVRARWAGFPVTLAFRTHRWAAHMEEHTLQVEKTLASLGIVPRESHRLHRLLCRAWGDIEAIVLSLPADRVEEAASDRVAGDQIRVAVEGAHTLVRDAASAVSVEREGETVLSDPDP